ncbi:MAG: PAS domain S-box protein [Desulfobacteraceae bacterium]|nr:PAS domain S-box protein [Desulfobacteraceae bacterium]
MTEYRKKVDAFFSHGLIGKSSISRNLTLSLAILVLVVVAAILTLIYLKESQDMYREIELQADQYIYSISETLSIPMWNIDADNIKLVGSVYSNTEALKQLEVINFTGDVLFSYKADTLDTGNMIKRTRNIEFNNRTIGKVSISLGNDRVQDELARLLNIVMLLLIVSIVVILVSTRFLLMIFLRSPLHALQQVIDRVAKGDYAYHFNLSIDPELDRIAEQFEDMAAKVAARELSQFKMNEKLQVEISERKQTENELVKSQVALHESEKKFRGIVERNFDGILVIDLEGNFVYLSPSVEVITGYKAEDLIGTGFLEYIVKSDRPAALRDLEDLLNGAEIRSLRLKIVKKDGTLIHIDANSAPITTDGKVTGIQTIFRDVSDQVHAEHEIRRLNKELEARVEQRTIELKRTLKELEAFSYTVSHDLRAPLRHMNGFVQLLRKRQMENLDETSKRYIEHIISSSLRMDQLIVDLLAFSRSGQTPINRQLVDLSRLTDEIRKELSKETQGRTIEWQIDPLPVIEGDVSLLRQAMRNLLENSVKFTAVRDTAHIRIGILNEVAKTHKTIMFIRDDGAGFDQRYVDKLFDVFQRQHSEDEFEGTGIGLAIARRIIHRHGGDIWAEGRIGDGATFYLSFNNDNRLDP